MQRKTDFTTIYSAEHARDFGLRTDSTFEDSPEDNKKDSKPSRSKVTTLTWNCCRFFLFCVFTVPCAYVIEEYYREYGSNKRVLDVQYPTPEPEMPGITICNSKNLLKKSSLCHYSGELCSKLMQSKHPDGLVRELADDLDLKVLKELSYHKGEVLKSCYIKSNKKLYRTTVCRQALWVLHKGNLCFMINFQKNEQEDFSGMKNPKLLMVLGADNRQYLKPNIAAGLDVYIHSPEDIPEEKDAHFTAFRGAKYDITYTKASDIVNQIGDCTHYEDNLVPDVRFPRIRNKNTCYVRCMWKQSRARHGCVAPSLTVFEGMTRCQKKIQDSKKFFDIPTKSINRCWKKCKEDCDRYKYEIKKDMEKSMFSWRKFEINVTIQLTPTNITYYTHRPKTSTLDVFGYVIAAVGMFMGLAFPGLVDKVQLFVSERLNENPRWAEFWDNGYANDEDDENEYDDDKDDVGDEESQEKSFLKPSEELQNI